MKTAFIRLFYLHLNCNSDSHESVRTSGSVATNCRNKRQPYYHVERHPTSRNACHFTLGFPIQPSHLICLRLNPPTTSTISGKHCKSNTAHVGSGLRLRLKVQNLKFSGSFSRLVRRSIPLKGLTNQYATVSSSKRKIHASAMHPMSGNGHSTFISSFVRVLTHTTLIIPSKDGNHLCLPSKRSYVF